MISLGTPALAIALCCTPFLVPSQAVETKEAPRQSHNSSVHTAETGKFTSPDHSFEFHYSRLLLRCEANKSEDGSISWGPDSCGAYSPMCENDIGTEEQTVACFAYRKETLKNYPEFDGATFSVARIAESADDCFRLPESWSEVSEHRNLGRVTIHDVNFVEFNVTEGGMSHYLDRQIYRAFHRDVCYELTVRVAGVTPGVLGMVPPQKSFGKKKQRVVHDELERSLSSFRFLN